MLAIGAGAWLATSLPWHGRDLTATGVAKPVEIVRDAHGVPHIFADTDDDAYFALGLVHAQDRFWQMEMMRRFGAGRLAEVFGPEAVASDKWMRLLGLHGLAERMVGDAAPPVRRALEAYADGVNAWLAHDIGLLAPELALFRYAPEPWRPADSLVWGKIMAARLSGNWRGEALRARLAKKLPPARVRELWPAYPADGPLSVARVPGPAALYAGLDALAPWPAAWPRGASNAWAVAPERTTTGGAILANDPHLGFGAPILWYLARIEAPGFSVTGATVPGVPFMILGHTDRIAWGMTTTQSDLEDLFVEKIDANEPDRYVTATGSRPFYRRKEVIKVKGAPDVVFTARATDHGPVISDLRPRAAALAGDGHVISLAATYLQPGDRSADAFFGVNRAKDWQAFRAALAHFQGPQQNFLYADTAGHIGFLAAGKVPVRGAGRGFVPTAGWT
ncbi:MAG: penicillin acylase family protein, partial [Magnetovibrio sp.]|nr:penicillin acylase family protein [Magnetovibrio sp.]